MVKEGSREKREAAISPEGVVAEDADLTDRLRAATERSWAYSRGTT